MTKERLIFLIRQYQKNFLTNAEAKEMENFIRENPDGEEIRSVFGQLLNDQPPATDLDEAAWEQMARQLLAGDQVEEAMVIDMPRKVSFPHRRIWAAAVVLLLAGAGTYFWMTGKKETGPSQPTATVTEVMPAEGATVLVLADGNRMVLDSLDNGVIKQQNGTEIVLNNRQLSYGKNHSSIEKIEYNTLSTPRGRQFQLSLPDGSKVWLNAGSSIRFPTSFGSAERRVYASGEIYFQVAADEKRPFIAVLRDSTKVEVLGTEFNVSAYENDPSSYITLLQGSIRVINNKRNVLLKPNQQAHPEKEKIEISEVEVESITAWRHGAFNFENVTLTEAMRQLELWYDVEVVIEPGLPATAPFYGQVSRNVSLNYLLKLFEKSNLKFKIENGKKLIVSK